MTLIYRIIYSSWINFILRNLNKALAPVFKDVKLPPSGVFSFKLKDNRIKFATNQTDPVAQRIFWNGPYEYEYVEIFEDIISKCSSFIDVGSNAGLYSMVAVSANPKIKVVAFDPTNASAHYFKKNIVLNNFEKQITFIQEAITGEKGEITFYEVRNKKYPYLVHNLGGASSAVNKPKEFNEVTVKSNNLIGVLDERNLNGFKIDFVKVDAEGVEPEIIKGMKEIIERDSPIVVCEVLFNQNEDELERLFLDFNYEFYGYVYQKGLVKLETLTRESDNEIRDCFFVPKDKLSLIQDHIIK